MTKVIVTIGMKSIEDDTQIEFRHCAEIRRNLRYMLMRVYPNWRFATWLWQGTTQVIFKEE